MTRRKAKVRSTPAVHTDRTGRIEMVRNLSESIDQALSLLHAYGPASKSVEPPPQSALMGLVDQCRHMCAQPNIANEPVRTIHHFACTGGTLVSKCIAAMPNIQLLSEVDPLSTLALRADKPLFSPTDLITRVRQSTRGADDETLIRLFLKGMSVLQASATDVGHRLVIRDHAHSQFCSHQNADQRPTLLEIVRQQYATLSILTVRDPVESYTSLRANNWLHFEPATYDEYCSRYLAFLQRYEGIPVFKYEDITGNTIPTMQKICAELHIPYQDQFENLFGAFELTGDSGRKSDQIETRKLIVPDEKLQAEIEASNHHKQLAKILHYANRLPDSPCHAPNVARL